MRYPLVLAYHDVSPHFRLTGNRVYPSQFKKHLLGLLRRFSPVDPNGMSYPLPRDGFLLTFDDALRGVYEYAYPIMEALGVKGMVFVVAGFMGKKNLWDATFGRPSEHMGKREIRALHSSGWVIGSHTLTHRALTFLPRKEVEEELRISKEILEDVIGDEVWAIAYPFNRYNDEVLKLAMESGYSWGFAGPSLRGKFSPLNVPRIPVFITDCSIKIKLNPLTTLLDMAFTSPSILTPVYQRLKKVV